MECLRNSNECNKHVNVQRMKFESESTPQNDIYTERIKMLAGSKAQMLDL